MERLLQVSLPVDPDSASAARMLVGEAVSDLPPAKLADVALLTHELVMNGVRHGSTRSSGDGIEVMVDRAEDQVRVEVVDQGEGFPRRAAGDRRGPRLGLRFVSRIADHWGITHTDRTRVWFEVALPRDE